MINESDRKHLERCVELAKTALEKGDQPFGSVLVSEGGAVLAEDYNHVGGGDHTSHPEFALAKWAVVHMPPAERPVHSGRCGIALSIDGQKNLTRWGTKVSL